MDKDESSQKVIDFLRHDLANENQNLPIAIMSAHMNEQYGKRVRIKGPNIFGTLQKPLKKGQITQFFSGGKNVLILDDDADMIGLLKSSLEKIDLHGFSVLDERHALRVLENTKFLFAIVDHKLGSSKTTQHFLDRLADIEGLNKDLPIILTGKEIEEENLGRKDLNVINTLKKPFPPKTFQALAKEIKITYENQEESQIIIEGEQEDLKENAQTVKGQIDEDESSRLISGEKDNQKDAIKVSGDKQDEDDAATTVKGGDNAQEDKFSQTITGAQQENESNLKLKSGSSEEEEGPKDLSLKTIESVKK
jgi:CheY-like chemotaxis protein